MSGYYWVDVNSRTLPGTAVLGGSDSDGQPIYVGRAYYNGDWIPAKVIPGRHPHCAYVAYAGKEIPMSQYQVLCEQRFEWVPSSNGAIPANAVVGGNTSTGESLFIGRAHHNGSLTVGKVHPSHRTCYISYGGREHSHKTYDVLVRR